MNLQKLFFPLVVAGGLLHAESSVGLDINNDDLELLASVNLNVLTDYEGGTAYFLNAGYLHTAGDDLASFGISGQNTVQGIEGLTLGLGINIVMTDNLIGLPLVAKAAYRLPFYAIPTTSLGVSYAFSPKVLTFLDGENYKEFKVEGDMEIISKFHVFTGYRNIKTDYEDYHETFNNSFYGGMKLSF